MAFEIKKNVLKQYIPELGQTEVTFHICWTLRRNVSANFAQAPG